VVVVAVFDAICIAFMEVTGYTRDSSGRGCRRTAVIKKH
jgi:hypothetical protein